MRTRKLLVSILAVMGFIAPTGIALVGSSSPAQAGTGYWRTITQTSYGIYTIWYEGGVPYCSYYGPLWEWQAFHACNNPGAPGGGYPGML